MEVETLEEALHGDRSEQSIPNVEIQRNALMEEIRKLNQLPRASTYAQHRLKIAETALVILNKRADEINAGDMDELEKALKQLGL